MKTVNLSYGKTGIVIDVPEDADIFIPRYQAGLTDETCAIRQALRNPIGTAPLSQKVHPGDKAVIVHTDITRPTPNHQILPVLLEELEEAGIHRSDITLLNALGTHRQQTESELRKMLGDSIVEHYACIQHNAWDDANLASLGKTSLGHPVRINRAYINADVKILTGFIEPHPLAGFSGGPKSVLPGIAGFESVLSNHGRNMIAHPKATWGVTEGNPIWEEMCDVAQRTEPTLLVNVTLNRQHQITGVFAGDLISAHKAGCAFVGSQALIRVDHAYDIVVTTNGGYPLDQNLYQSCKGISAASRVVRQGGAIILVAACQDGLPMHGNYISLLQRGGSPQGVLDMLAVPGFASPDQWAVQNQAQDQLHADVYVHSQGLTDDQIRLALFTPLHDLPAALDEFRHRYGCRICVLPEGPLVIPTLVA